MLNCSLNNNENDDIANLKYAFSDRFALTVKEAALYFGIGEKKIKRLTDDPNCPFVLWNGNKRLIKRARLEKYLDEQFSI